MPEHGNGRFSAAAAEAPAWQRYDAYRLSVEMWLALGDGAQARKALERLEDRDHQAVATLRLWHKLYPRSTRGPGEGVWAEMIAALRLELGEAAQAEAALERALARFPHDRGVLKVMRDFQLSQGRPAQALVHAKRLQAAYETASLKDILSIFRNHVYFAGRQIPEDEKLELALKDPGILAEARREREDKRREARETVARIEASLSAP